MPTESHIQCPECAYWYEDRSQPGARHPDDRLCPACGTDYYDLRYADRWQYEHLYG